MRDGVRAEERTLRCTSGHVVGVELLSGWQIVTIQGRQIIGRQLSIGCRCGAFWESPEVQSIREMLARVDNGPLALEFARLLDRRAPAAAAGSPARTT